MIVLSAITVGITSGVAEAAFPAEAHAPRSRLASISVINSLEFMILLPPKIFLIQSYGFEKKLPRPAGEFLLSEWIGIRMDRCTMDLSAVYICLRLHCILPLPV